MRVKKVKFHGENTLMVYITKEESFNETIQKKIQIYKDEYKDIAVFVGGDINIEEVLTRIIQEKI